MRSRSDIEQAIDQHGSTAWRVCVLYFSNSADAQDAFQETMLKYSLADKVHFNDEEHRKAWLIRVATNVCKDMLKASNRLNLSLDAAEGVESFISHDEESQPSSYVSDVVQVIHSLDDPPRTPLYLSLYEGYTAPEIADLLEAPVNTVYSWIARGKKLLKEALS